MGYLDHSTNNIILDAVLTDYGRNKLASNVAFTLTDFSLGDDEVDYSLIKKYGRTVGKEKIEKNTPIFEALTNDNIALKYKLIGKETNASTTNISGIYMPYLTFSGTPPTLTNVLGSNNATITISLFYNGSQATSAYAQTYQIKVSDRFFSIVGASGTTMNAGVILNATDPNQTKIYQTLTTAASLSFTITAKSIDPTKLSVYGKRINATQRQITSYITITGDADGSTKDIPVTYTATI